MDWFTFWKLTLLVLVIWLWLVLIVRAIKGQEVHALSIGMACTSLVGFCYMQGWIV